MRRGEWREEECCLGQFRQAKGMLEGCDGMLEGCGGTLEGCDVSNKWPVCSTS